MLAVMDGIGKQLRTLRRARALTQTQLAAKAGVSPTTIIGIERGQHEPQVGTIRKLSTALDVPPERIILGDGT
jgi:transcriptional regulator with XRE-family HTH domain